ncbi:elongation factor P maturation arginine rhamnosyltransferase EarP [Pseudomonas sp. sp1636]|uniref:elongation factor P maturation arginine rhamnosyltransferase EarP n=1 Tax=Pseudomonas sp. sp1636 TaxID=3036707 RepID=UPI0025A65023|nr:elongation factor P maturation arginine rhamnosyltransferase EarP [Pseudomonas sp. sp1636]MDM8350520.1 elongation factor P maturation arginine rhamnosyltransferase EarP [Pseudomonas sp. sp1636]
MRPTWDIFCSVVDNYGDIGVTWRLARQLVAEHDAAVRLWVDDLLAFARLCPAADVRVAQQSLQGVDVRQWPAPWLPVEAADVVIEAFACELPTAYVAAMARRARPSLWLNLEYLSAEDWVGGCHGLPSMQSTGLQKFFFFPGFRPETGGLLREAGLLERRRNFQQDPAARQAFLQRLGVAPLANARLISLFAYENCGLASWLDVLAAGCQPTHMLVPEGRVLGDVQAWLGVRSLTVGSLEVRGALTVQVLPFVTQDDYDRLLWSCDFNAVRGEDSFVRAQWAGRPLLWHIYEQQENVHLEKLEAFLALYTQGLSPAAGATLTALWQAWNHGEGVGESWLALQQAWPELAEHAEAWSLEQASQTDLAEALVEFYLNWL